MMPEIIVGVDDSTGALDALAFATRIAEHTGASVRAVTAFNYSDTPSRASNEAYREFLKSDARAVLDTAIGASSGHVDATEVVADPSAAHALHALAEERGAALVVVGSSRHGAFGRVVPGSTGERLLHGSPCPVAIVPGGYATAGPIRTIGVGYDASEEADAALAAACALARHTGATLRIIRAFDATHVGTPALMTTSGWDSMRDQHEVTQRAELEHALAQVPDDVTAEPLFLIGRASQVLAAQSQRVDAMVVGSRGYGPRKAVLLGGVTHGLIRRAGCPVIVLPHGAQTMAPLFAAAEAAAC
jgi:nucleotide-binding universal stress UspA family protein